MDNIEFMKGIYQAFAAGDVATVLGAMSDDIEWFEAEGHPWYPGRAFIGPQQVVEGVFARIQAEIDGFEIIPERFLSDGDEVAMIGRYHGKGIAKRRAARRTSSPPLDAEGRQDRWLSTVRGYPPAIGGPRALGGSRHESVLSRMPPV